MISDLAAGDEVRQRDVSLPFYFICLLHLANEHVSLFLDGYNGCARQCLCVKQLL
jgi:hypothetical protein